MVSVRRDSSSYFNQRLVFEHKDGQSAKYKVVSKGIRLANIFQRIFGRSTRVWIKGQMFHVNTRSLKKYYTEISGSFEGLSTDVARAADKARAVGSSLLRLHGERKEQPLRPRNVSVWSTPSEELTSALEREQVASLRLDEAKARMREAEARMCKLDRDETKDSFKFALGQVKKELFELFVLSLDNQDVVREKLEKWIEKADLLVPYLARETGKGEHEVEQVLYGTLGLVSSLLLHTVNTVKRLKELARQVKASDELSSALDAQLQKVINVFCSLPSEIVRVYEENEELPGQGGALGGVQTALGKAENWLNLCSVTVAELTSVKNELIGLAFTDEGAPVFCELLEILELGQAVLSGAGRKAESLAPQIDAIVRGYRAVQAQKEPTVSKRRFKMLQGAVTRNAVRVVWNHKKRLGKSARGAVRRSLSGDTTPVRFKKLKGRAQKWALSLLSDNRDVVVNEVSKLFAKSLDKARAQRRASDPDYQNALKELKAAEAVFKKEEKALEAAVKRMKRAIKNEVFDFRESSHAWEIDAYFSRLEDEANKDLPAPHPVSDDEAPFFDALDTLPEQSDVESVASRADSGLGSLDALSIRSGSGSEVEVDDGALETESVLSDDSDYFDALDTFPEQSDDESVASRTESGYDSLDDSRSMGSSIDAKVVEHALGFSGSPGKPIDLYADLGYDELGLD